MKAIETRYKGYRFRSRLEARWAVFFDEMHIVWEYEPEGFDLESDGLYLPDFFLTEMGWFAECKGSWRDDPDSIKRCAALAIATSKPVIFLNTPPDKNFPWIAFSDTGELWKDGWMRFIIAAVYAAPGTSYRDLSWNRAVDSALGARFEHGENGGA